MLRKSKNMYYKCNTELKVKYRKLQKQILYVLFIFEWNKKSKDDFIDRIYVLLSVGFQTSYVNW